MHKQNSLSLRKQNCLQVCASRTVFKYAQAKLSSSMYKQNCQVCTNKTLQVCTSKSGSCEDFQLLRNQLEHTKTQHKKLPSVHILGDFNFRDIVWPDRLSKTGTMLSQSKGQVLVDIMNDHGLEQLVNFPTREENTLDMILTSLPGQFQEVHSPDKLNDHNMVAGTL